MNSITRILLAILLTTGCLIEMAQATNFVIVLADDLGYGDIGCYGHPTIQTPNLDRFAAEGMRFTNCYAAHPNCSPSRTGLMTGRTPFRVGIYNWIPMFSPMHVRRNEITIATLLQKAGYDTCHVGKWHLNGDFNLPSQPQPSDHGFNHWFSTQNNALPNHHNPDNFVRNGKEVGQLKGYSAQLVAAEARDWLKDHRDSSKPFFLFVCFHEPHEPIATDPKFQKHYPNQPESLAPHHGNVTQLDDGFGKLIAALDEFGLRDDTMILFTSDNGPAITGMHPHGSSGELRDKKGAIYEGGIRVPGILQWPGHVASGSVCDQPICGVDLLPTLCDIAHIDPPQDRTLDGASFLPAIEGRPIQRRQALYWQFNRARSDVKVAIRRDQWKLVARLDKPDRKPSGGIPEDEMESIKTASLIDFRLYDLKQDPAESNNVAAAHESTFAELKSEMNHIYGQVVAEAPVWPAWEWPRYESGRIQWPDYWLNRKRTTR